MTESLGPLRSKKQHSTSLDIESLGAFTRPDKALPALDAPRQKPPAVKAWKCQLALAITQISFCCGSVYLKRALRAVDSTKGQNFHPIIYAFTREVIAAPIMCSMAWASSRVLPKRSDLLHVSALGVCLFFNQLMYIIGISLSGVLVATCMQPTIPVFTAMIAVCLRLEAGSIQKVLGIGLAVAGSVSMVAGGVSGQHQTAAEGHKMLMGNACLLANTLAMAIYFITAKQLVLKYPPMCVAAWAYITAAVCMGAAAAAFVEQKDWQLPSIMLGPLAYWVVVCSVIGYYVVTWATQYLPASQVAAFQCLQPFVGAVLAFAVLGEEPSIWDVGAIGVIAGLVLVAKDPIETTAMFSKIKRIVSQTSLAK
ncbi:TPA: hypothetical protein ACH3X3_002373 [Trebouxia sp. C0006]